MHGVVTIYLAHFERPISDKHTCQHYIGSAKNLENRVKKHRTFPDARLMQVAQERGIGFTIARTWQGPRSFEKYLKSKKSGPKLCPICAEKKDKNALRFYLASFSLDDLPELSF